MRREEEKPCITWSSAYARLDRVRKELLATYGDEMCEELDEILDEALDFIWNELSDEEMSAIEESVSADNSDNE